MIDFSDTLDHRQLYAQLKQEVADGRRYWLSDDEIERLIEENERFQRIDSLGEMIAELFIMPEKPDEARWMSTTEVLKKLQNRFGMSQLKNVTPKKVGDTLGSRQFIFESKHTNSGTKYYLAER